MFGLQTLDVILGLVFIYLLLSLVCTAVNEVIAQWLNWRAETLRTAIRGIFTSGDEGDAEDGQVTATEARNMRDMAAAACQTAAPTEFDAYQKTVETLEAAQLALAAQGEKESAARARLSRAEGNLSTAMGGKADAAAVQTLQAEVAAARTAVEQLVPESRATAENVTAAKRSRDAAFDELKRGAGDGVRQLRAAEGREARAHGQELTVALYEHPIVMALSQPRVKYGIQLKVLPKYRTIRLPAYIPARAFSAALVDVIAPGAPPSSISLAPLRTQVQALPHQIARPITMFIDSAGGDFDRFRTSLETWYEDAMERVSGLYKRKVQLSVLTLAAIVTLLANADTVRMARALASNQALREGIVAQAQALANYPGEDINALLAAARPDTQARRQAPAATPAPAAGDSTTGAAADTTAADTASAMSAEDSLRARLRADSIARFRLRQLRGAIDSLQAIGLPLGWRGPCKPKASASTKADTTAKPAKAGRAGTPAESTASCRRLALPGEDALGRIVGLLLTMLAISLGAPFWFDVLNRIVNIRAAGRAPEEKPKPPEALPPATGAWR